MDFHLINLDCPSCGSAMKGEPTDILFFCTHCGAGAIIAENSLETLQTTALLPAAGHRADIWKPAWKIRADISISDRILFGGRASPSSSAQRSFLLPAFELGIRDVSRLCRGLSVAGEQSSEIPHAPCHGGVLDLEDTLILLRYLVLEEEIEKPDRLASVKVEIQPVSHHFCLIPFEKKDQFLRCAITGISIPNGSPA